MAAIRCTCVEKFRKASGQIFGYRLQAADGSVLDIDHDGLKGKMKSNKIVVDNLQISIDGKIIDKVPTASTLDDLEKFIVEAANGNKGAIQLKNIDRNNTAIRVFQEYQNCGGSDDVWMSCSEKYMTVISVSRGKIDSTTYSCIETDGSDTEYEYIKKTTDRCKQVDATKENVTKYGLVWASNNAFNYSKMPKQQMLEEKITEKRNQRPQKKTADTQDVTSTASTAENKQSKFNQLAEAVRSAYETREIPNDMLQSCGRGGSDYVAVVTGDYCGVIIFPTMEYGKYVLPYGALTVKEGISDIKKLSSISELKAILNKSASNKANSIDIKVNGAAVLGYNNGHEILEGNGGYSSPVTAWNSLEYWKSLDSQEREAEYNDPKSPWYHYDGIEESQDPHPDWY